jgi:hypothetical protein
MEVYLEILAAVGNRLAGASTGGPDADVHDDTGHDTLVISKKEYT